MVERESSDRDRMYLDVLLAEHGLSELLMEINSLMSYRAPSRDSYSRRSRAFGLRSMHTGWPYLAI